MEKTQKEVIRLTQNKVMEYDWGSTDKNCIIAELTNKECKRYAEFWMGTHKNGPSVMQDNRPLSQFLKERNISDLPFLFKVLCIEKALSIQLHPNKEQAERLYSQKPGLYADDNQKPEMFLTLTEFQCLFGIIPKEELQRLCECYPFSLLATRHSGSIKKIIAQLLHLPEEAQMYMIDQLLKNVESIMPERKDILNRLQKQFPYDVGILVSCLLRYKKLPAGECYAIDAGVPHAYLKGSCMEIMKNSDNVVRLGLTPKLKDIPTMLEIMNERIGLDGIKVESFDHGYQWNGLIIRQVESISAAPLEIFVPFLSICIIFSGQIAISELKISAKKGEVLFFTPGKYVTKGNYKLILGSFEVQ